MFQLLSLAPPLPVIAGPLSDGQERRYLSDGDDGTAETIVVMQQLVSQGKRDDEVRREIGKILNGDYDDLPKCSNKDHLCYAEAVYTFARDHIKYAYDPHLVEYVESARRILKNRIADCDSIVILMAAMLENIGLETQFVTIKADPDRPDEFSHVYLRVKVPGVGWIPLDPTMPRKYFGWEAPGQHVTKYWPGSSDAANMPVDTSPSVSLPAGGMSGLGCGPNGPCGKCSGSGIPAPYPLGMNGPRYPMIPRATQTNDHRTRYFEGLANDAWQDEIGLNGGHETIYMNAYSYRGPMAGMGGLNDSDQNKINQAEAAATGLQSSDPGLYDFIKSMWDGSGIDQLAKMRRQLTVQQQSLLGSSNKGSQEYISARNTFKAAANAFNSAVSKWNTIAQTVNFSADTFGLTDHMAQMSPVAISGGLGNLGLPAALVPIAEFVVASPWAAVSLAAIGAVVVLVSVAAVMDLIQTMLQAIGLLKQTQSWFDKLLNLPKSLLDPLGTTALTIGGIALAGVAAYVAVKMLQKKGKI